jgi:hypothetical protein
MHNDLVDNYLILIIKEIKNKEAYIWQWITHFIFAYF